MQKMITTKLKVQYRHLHVYYTSMTKKLTITIDDEVYDGLYRRIGPRRISRFLESLARPHVIDEALQRDYETMAADEEREAGAMEWSEALIGDVADDPR